MQARLANGAEIYTVLSASVAVFFVCVRSRIFRAHENGSGELDAPDEKPGNGPVGDQHSALSTDHEKH